MSSKDRKRRRSLVRIRPKRQSDDHQNIGYGRPPRAHQFKPGRSGNPKGRPKGARNESTILRGILDRKILTHSGGKSKKISILEGILLRIIEDSLKGNTKSAAFVLNRYAAMVSGELPQHDLSDEDREVLEAFAARVGKRRTGKGGEQ